MKNKPGYRELRAQNLEEKFKARPDLKSSSWNPAEDDWLHEFRKPKHGDTWGFWRLNRKGSEDSLDWLAGYYVHNPYWIGKSRCSTLDDFAMWVLHLSGKAGPAWDGLNAVGNFCNAISDCGWV